MARTSLVAALRQWVPRTAFGRAMLVPAGLSLVALLPWEPQGPYDARDYQRIEGAELVPVGQAWLEPFLAPGRILLGAPDFRLAILSTLVWALLLVVLLSWWPFRTGARRYSIWRNGSGTLRRWGLLLLLSFAYLLTIAAVNHQPGWQLVLEDEGALIADLQSHTMGSHDGIATPRRNLDWHRERGYDVVAVTEHYDITGSLRTASLAPDDLLVLVGVEERDRQTGGFLLGLGLKEGVPFAEEARGEPDFATRFIEAVHTDHEGAVIALAWRLNPDDVAAYAERGVDGFEIANMGHPDVPLEVRDRLLSMQEKHGSVLVASSDWHGWGGFNRTWTLFRLAGIADLGPEARKAALIDSLREGRFERFTPVVAGYLGPPPAWRVALAPLVETVRYAGALSMERVVAWWSWSALFLLLFTLLKHLGVDAGRLIVSGGLLVMAGLLASRGFEWMSRLPLVVGHGFPAEAGRIAMAVAGLCAVVGLFMLRRMRG